MEKGLEKEERDEDAQSHRRVDTTDDDVATDDDRESLEPSRFARVERRRSETSAVHLVEKNYAERGSFLRVERVQHAR